MASNTVADEKKRRLMVRVNRHLACNPPGLVESFLDTINKVLDNILENPQDPKFRELRASNKLVQRNVTGCHGGREFLHLLGFEKILSQGGQPAYFLAEPNPEFLTQAKTWINEQAALALGTEGARAGRDACADGVLQVKLTSGQTLEGGFSAGETISDVYSFVHASVVDSSEDFRLRLPQAGGVFGENQLGMTLMDAQLLPRSTLVVVKRSSQVQPFQPRDADEVEARAKAAEDLQKLKRSQAQTRQSREAEKKRLLAEFQGDREDQHIHEHLPNAHSASAQAGQRVVHPVASLGVEEVKTSQP